MEYVKEDDAILVGSGMMREGKEAVHSFNLTKSLIENFPDKQFIFDAGSLQVMRPEWLLSLKKTSRDYSTSKKNLKNFLINQY